MRRDTTEYSGNSALTRWLPLVVVVAAGLGLGAYFLPQQLGIISQKQSPVAANAPAEIVSAKLTTNQRTGQLAEAPPSTADNAHPQVAAAKTEGPDGTISGQYGDWQIVCKDPPPGAKNGVCALVQSVTAEDRNNIGLTVYFQKFSNGARVLRVFAPLGVLLPTGLGLKIDDKDVGHAPFLRCHSFACYAQVVVEDPLVEQLKTGKTAIFIIFQTEEAGIGIPISLNGFGDALAALK